MIKATWINAYHYLYITQSGDFGMMKTLNVV